MDKAGVHLEDRSFGPLDNSFLHDMGVADNRRHPKRETLNQSESAETRVSVLGLSLWKDVSGLGIYTAWICMEYFAGMLETDDKCMIDPHEPSRELHW